MGRGREGVVVGHRLGGGAGADHADPAGARGGDRAPGRGQDHLDHGYVVPLPGVAQHGGRGGVARDDQRLDAAVDQVVEALEGVLADLRDRLGAVGLAGGVAEVDDRLVRQLVDHGPGHGEPTEAGVEDADGSIGGRLLAQRPRLRPPAPVARRRDRGHVAWSPCADSPCSCSRARAPARAALASPRLPAGGARPADRARPTSPRRAPRTTKVLIVTLDSVGLRRAYAWPARSARRPSTG